MRLLVRHTIYNSCPTIKSSTHPQLEMHHPHFWRHRTFDPDFWQTRFQNFDPLHSTHFDRFQFYRGRMMYYRGPSRIFWFTFGVFAATWYHRAHARGDLRGWGPCGNRRIEEWRAQRIAETATREQFPANNANQQKKNETTGEWSWSPATPPSFEDEEVRRRWEEKTRKAQETVRALFGFWPF